MLDRAKVVLFDWLGSRLAQPGSLPPVAVLDLFAGSGGLGIECLSRGAIYACFVERGGPAVRALRENLRVLGAEQRSGVVVGDALTVSIPEPPGGTYSIVFLDPPYHMTQSLTPGDRVVRRIEELGRHEWIAAGALLAIRQSIRAGPVPPVPGWDVADRREVGTMVLTLLCRTAATQPTSSG